MANGYPKRKKFLKPERIAVYEDLRSLRQRIRWMGFRSSAIYKWVVV